MKTAKNPQFDSTCDKLKCCINRMWQRTLLPWTLRVAICYILLLCFCSKWLLSLSDWPAPYFDNILNHDQSSLLISKPHQVQIKARAGQQVVVGGGAHTVTVSKSCSPLQPLVKNPFPQCRVFIHVGSVSITLVYFRHVSRFGCWVHMQHVCVFAVCVIQLDKYVLVFRYYWVYLHELSAADNTNFLTDTTACYNVGLWAES